MAPGCSARTILYGLLSAVIIPAVESTGSRSWAANSPALMRQNEMLVVKTLLPRQNSPFTFSIDDTSFATEPTDVGAAANDNSESPSTAFLSNTDAIPSTTSLADTESRVTRTDLSEATENASSSRSVRHSTVTPSTLKTTRSRSTVSASSSPSASTTPSTDKPFRLGPSSIAAAAVICTFVAIGICLMIHHWYRRRPTKAARNESKRTVPSSPGPSPVPKSFDDGMTSTMSLRESMMYHPDYRQSRTSLSSRHNAGSIRLPSGNGSVVTVGYERQEPFSNLEPSQDYQIHQTGIAMSDLGSRYEPGPSPISPLLSPYHQYDNNVNWDQESHATHRDETHPRTSPPLSAVGTVTSQSSWRPHRQASDWPMPNTYSVHASSPRAARDDGYGQGRWDSGWHPVPDERTFDENHPQNGRLT